MTVIDEGKGLGFTCAQCKEWIPVDKDLALRDLDTVDEDELPWIVEDGHTYCRRCRFTCSVCEEICNSDDDGYYVESHGDVCSECYWNEINSYSSTLLHYHEEQDNAHDPVSGSQRCTSQQSRTKRVDKYVICDWGVLDGEYYEELRIEDVPVIAGPRQHHMTDGWRGYYDTPVNGDDYLTITDTWIPTTGRDRDLPSKDTLFDLSEILMDENEPSPPGEGLWILVEPTSNVCACNICILCHKNDEEAVKQWLKEVAWMGWNQVEAA